MQPFFGFAFPGRCGIIVFRKRTKGFFPRMNGTFDQLHENELPPLKKLEEAGVGFIRITHPAADTMELCRGIGEEYGAKHPKNLFLANKHGTEFFLLLMDAEKPYRTSIVSKKLGSTRLSFGGSEQLHDVLGLRQGDDDLSTLRRHGIYGILAKILYNPLEKRCAQVCHHLLRGKFAKHLDTLRCSAAHIQDCRLEQFVQAGFLRFRLRTYF